MAAGDSASAHAGLRLHLKVLSRVELILLFAVETLEAEIVDAFPGFKKRFEI